MEKNHTFEPCQKCGSTLHPNGACYDQEQELHHPGCHCHQASYPSSGWVYDERCLWYPERELTKDERRIFILEKKLENYTHAILVLIFLGFGLSFSGSENRVFWVVGVVAVLVLLNTLSEKSIVEKSIRAKIQSSIASRYSNKATNKK